MIMPDLSPQFIEGNSAASVAGQVGEQVKFVQGKMNEVAVKVGATGQQVYG